MKMHVLAACLVAGLFAGPALAAEALPMPITGYGNITDIAGALEKPDPSLRYKLLFDISTPARDVAKPHQTLIRIARLLNAMAANGVRPQPGDIALVVHGAPDTFTLTDAAHVKRHKMPNPNLDLVHQLAAAGVSVRICGQSYLGHGYARDELDPVVELDLMAMTTIANLMAKGYGVVPG